MYCYCIVMYCICICIVFVFVLNVKEDMKTCKLDVEDIWGDITTNQKWMETETTTNRFLVMEAMVHLLPPLAISLEGNTMFMTLDCPKRFLKIMVKSTECVLYGGSSRYFHQWCLIVERLNEKSCIQINQKNSMYWLLARFYKKNIILCPCRNRKCSERVLI